MYVCVCAYTIARSGWIDRDAKCALCESRDTRMVDKENWWDICEGRSRYDGRVRVRVVLERERERESITRLALTLGYDNLAIRLTERGRKEWT